MSLNLQKYQSLSTLLVEFRHDITNEQLNARQCRERLAALQELFTQQILPLTDVDTRVQSYQTEISKQLRLLEVDIMFFQGARQISTSLARLKTIGDRLTTLIRYCEAVLQPEENGER